MKEKTVALAGNPNVGKSTVFNELTGMQQHTGNWIGKTVDTKAGVFTYRFQSYRVIDLPGTYSLHAASQEEEIAGAFIRSGQADCTVCVVDATLLERSLVLVLEILQETDRAVVLLNLCDEAKKKGIWIDDGQLAKRLGVPVVKATARSGKGMNRLLEQIHLVAAHALQTHPQPCAEGEIYMRAKSIADAVVRAPERTRESIADKLLLGRLTSFLSMGILLALVLWLTVRFSNYPSDLLKQALDEVLLRLAHMMQTAHMPNIVIQIITQGILKILFWVIAVMLPPMAIFFPLFAWMEDFGLLPRFAFNLDYGFEKCGACGKQALTCCMGLGCNVVGVTGARIMEAPRERLLAILTNSLTPCNGRFPMLIAIIGIFFSRNTFTAVGVLLLLMLLSFSMTMFSSRLLSKTLLRGKSSTFAMEMPPLRRPQLLKTLWICVREKLVPTLWRAVLVAAPAGLIIWWLAHWHVGNSNLLMQLAEALDGIGHLLGMDGVMLLAFLLAFPANEIVMPVALMMYASAGELQEFGSLQALGEMLIANGWNGKTALCVCVFALFHFPCAATLLTIYKETKSLRWTALSVLLPLGIGSVLCALINLVF